LFGTDKVKRQALSKPRDANLILRQVSLYWGMTRLKVIISLGGDWAVKTTARLDTSW
jgi:hypothetical protein